MKKILALGLCAAIGLGAMAQEALIKDAKAAVKDKKDFTEVAAILKPAMSDPATANNVELYFLPGQAAFKKLGEYKSRFTDQNGALLGLSMIHSLDPNAAAAIPGLLLGGYEYYMKALPLDTIVDAKGKTKTTHSKEIVKALGDYYPLLVEAGINCFNDNADYQGAYDLWSYYVTLPDRPAVAKNIANMPNDTLRSEIAYNMGLAAYKIPDQQKALEAFKVAEKLGYEKEQLYDAAMSVAAEIGDLATLNDFADRAIARFGDNDGKYVSTVIQGYINKKDYQSALNVINKAVAERPNIAQYYVLQGIIMDQDDVPGDPIKAFKKAAELDPQNKLALYYLGRGLLINAGAIYDATPDGPDFGKVFAEQIKPLLLESVDKLEAAYALDNDFTDPLNLLVQAYHLLGDQAKEKETEQRLLY